MSRRRLGILLRSALWLLVLALLAALGERQASAYDWTASGRHTLSDASLALLATLNAPVTATAYVYPGAQAEREIEARFAAYRRAKADFSLRIVDPATDPDAVRELGIERSGEVVLEYQGRRESLAELTEPRISGALQRLARAGRGRLRLITGHGERQIGDDGPGGLSRWAAILGEKGLRLESLDLALTPAIPEDTAALVLASPRQPLLPGETARVEAFLAAGGRLLWLFDPSSAKLPELAAALAVEPLAGTLVYQDYEVLGLDHPALALVAEYGPHPITAGLEELTVFPFAGGVSAGNDSDWTPTPLLRSPERSWLERGGLESPVTRDPDGDRPGPVLLGLALERDGGANGDRQRAAVIADSDFLTNAVIGQLGNRRLAVNLAQWLTGHDAHLDIDVPAAPDLALKLSPWQTRAFGLVYLALLPFGLAATGLVRSWWRGRRR